MNNNFQRALRNYILYDDLEVFKFVNEDKRDNLEIYKNNFYGFRLNFISKQYSQTKLLLGDAYFIQYAKKFVNLFKEENLYNLLDIFPDFLKDNINLSDLDYLYEFLLLEKLIASLYNQKDLEIEHNKNLNNEVLENANFKLKNNVFLYKASYNIKDIWCYIVDISKDHKKIPAPKVIKGNFYHLITKKDNIMILSLSKKDFDILSNSNITLNELEDPNKFLLDYFIFFDIC